MLGTGEAFCKPEVLSTTSVDSAQCHLIAGHTCSNWYLLQVCAMDQVHADLQGSQ